jgi:hypothetical protein
MSELTTEMLEADSEPANKSPVGWNPVRERHYKQFLRTLDWDDFGKIDAVRRHMYETWITKGVHPNDLKKPYHVGKNEKDYGSEF